MDMKPETVARLARERKAEAKRSWSEMIARLRDKYDAEPNRGYAELMWGGLLRELERRKQMLAYDYIDKDKQGDDCLACPTCKYNTSTTPAYADQPAHACVRDKSYVPGF